MEEVGLKKASFFSVRLFGGIIPLLKEGSRGRNGLECGAEGFEKREPRRRWLVCRYSQRSGEVGGKQPLRANLSLAF